MDARDDQQLFIQGDRRAVLYGHVKRCGEELCT